MAFEDSANLFVSEIKLMPSEYSSERSQALDGRVSVPAWWRQLAGRHGQLDFVLRNGTSAHTYAEIDKRSAAIARGLLADGATKGSRIGILMPNGPDWVACWLAISRIGGTAILLSTFSVPSEISYAVRHADISILLMADRYLRHDYGARMEEAFASLRDHDPSQPLAAHEAPFLRSIWVSGEARAWARGTLADLEVQGRESVRFGEALLSEIEAEVSPADPCVMIFTSGSTALPKAVVHVSGAIVAKAEYSAKSNQISPTNVVIGDRLLITAPFFWVGGLCALIGAMTKGAVILCADDHSPASLLETIRRDRPTHVGGSEALLRSIANVEGWTPSDFEGLKAMTSVQRAFYFAILGDDSISREQVPDVLGMTETIGPHTGVCDGEFRPKGGEITWGQPLDQMEIKIVDPETQMPVEQGEVGELLVRGPWLMDAMYKRLRRDVFDADGWYRTGDKCFVDAKGDLYFRGRLGAMIKTSGANVSPEEVEAAIRLNPDVLDVAVVPVSHPKMGQMVVAVIAAKEGSALTEDMIKDQLRGALSSFKIPKKIVFADYQSLPRTPSNKIRRPALIELISADGALTRAEGGKH